MHTSYIYIVNIRYCRFLSTMNNIAVAIRNDISIDADKIIGANKIKIELVNITTTHEQSKSNRRRSTIVNLLGEQVIIDDKLKWRVKLGQRGGTFFGLIGLILFVLVSLSEDHTKFLVYSLF